MTADRDLFHHQDWNTGERELQLLVAGHAVPPNAPPLTACSRSAANSSNCVTI